MVGAPLRVGLDLRSSSTSWIGGLYYLVNLAAAIRTLPREEQPRLVGLAPAGDQTLDLGAFAELLPVKLFTSPERPRPRRLLARAVRRPVGLGQSATRLGLDVVFPTFDRQESSAAILPWIPDVQHLRQPENFTEEDRERRTVWARRMLVDSPIVVVSSSAAAHDIEANFAEAAGKLRVLRFHTIVGDELLDVDAHAVARRYGLPARFLLLPNQFWVHKEHRTAFEAVRLLRERGQEICLACTGTPVDPRWPDHYAGLERFVAERGLEHEIRLLGRVPRPDYFQLIRAAHAVVQPSRFEGWSSTVEDARALGRPLVLSDIDVHLEQDPEHVRFFPVGDAEALADAMSSSWEESTPVDEQETRSRQRALVAGFARTALAIFDEAAGLAPRAGR